jgi:phage terminase large subunit-like protein
MMFSRFAAGAGPSKAAARYLASAASGCKPAEHHTVVFPDIEQARSMVMCVFCAVRIMHIAE